MNRSCLAILVVFGACNMDHQLGLFVPADSGVDSLNSNTLPTSSDAGVSTQADLQVGSDAQAYVGSDAKVIGQLGPSQSWTGYIENYQFPYSSEGIRFTFATDSTGQVVGTAVFGNGTPPPPATDPNVGYPPAGTEQGELGTWTQGFPYSMTDGSLTSNRIRFTLQYNELWSGWCALQTPFEDSGLCLPTWFGTCENGTCILRNPDNARQTITVDNGRRDLCAGAMVCLCSTATCVANASDSPTATFDVAISGTEASGSVAGGTGDRFNVHFTKDP
jgi:hypothetical protein